jgi:hypothetical protein
MGRHSVPDPDETPDHPRAGQGDDPDGFAYDEPDYGPGYGEPAYGEPGYGEPEYDEPAHGESNYTGTDYASASAGADDDYDDADYEEPAPGQPGYQADFWQRDEPEYRYEEADAPTHSFAANPPPPRPPVTGPAHGGEWEGGEWTGSHRAVQAGRRGISVGVIAALVTVVVVVGAIILWRFFGDALSNRSEVAAARCVEGEVAVAVVADPSIADPLRALADKYNQTADPVGDRCVKVAVKPADSDAVVNGFIGTWPGELGERPALWIPGSSVSEARLEAASGEQTVSDSRSLVTSPVVLAVRPQLKNALAQQNWSTLPSLQSNPTSLDGLNLQGWGALRLALPLTGDSDASYLAAEAVATTSAPPGAQASAGIPAVNTLTAGQPKLADTKASTAMDALLKATDPAAAPVHAVVSTEQQVYQRGGSLPDAKSTLASWLPPGPTAIADYPTVLLAGSWLSQEQVSAASEFARYLRKAEPMAELAKAGFRTDGGTPPKNDVTDLGALSTPVSVGDNAMRATLANTLTAPVESPAVTIMLDQSMSADEGGKSRLANVVAALNARLQALPQNSAVGLWTFDGTQGRSEVSTGPLSDPVNGQPRSAALTSALNSQTASGGGAVSFTTLRLIYDQINANFRQGQSNSILLITAGPHTDQSLDGQGLQQYVRGAFDQARPVAVNVIDFGNDSDRATWEAVAQASGGSYQNLPSSASPDLTSAITTFLS